MVNASDVRHGKILIVDDQTANVILLERMLRGAGYVAITSTTDPHEVGKLHRRNRYDLILLDLQMPGMDGFQVMEGLKETEPDGYLPVLVITAQPDHKLRALKAGAKDFVSKPFEFAEVLMRVYNMLEVRLLHRETKKLYDRIAAEQRVSERLLFNGPPNSAAGRSDRPLQGTADKVNEPVIDSFADVTVLFADIVELTNVSDRVSAEVLLGVLDDVYARFNGIADRRGVEKVNVIGDAYIAAAGMPVPVANHAARAAHMALDMVREIDNINEHGRYKLKVRIGMDSGAVVAGVIGGHEFLYDLWGDAVTAARRMESHGEAGRIQVTESTRQRLSDAFVLEKRNAIDVKGKGEMRTWFLNGWNG